MWRIISPAVQEAPPSSSGTYTAKELTEFPERRSNVIRHQNRDSAQDTETAVRKQRCDNLAQKKAKGAGYLKPDQRRLFFVDDPHCELILGTDNRVSCSACDRKIELGAPLGRHKWKQHIKSLGHRRNVGELVIARADYARRQQWFVEDPAVILLESDREIQCSLCNRKIKLHGRWGWTNWAIHLKRNGHQARAKASQPPS
ncbi:hypothetical protein DFP72DRAFT_855915 [Ephemerocybe angulata]|uniref:Uncharacterized protein n=1 Tax=Ephemerocybe angulata TaxID=980116 RepID=A0A8H6HHL6_9AGAR|nr:hypothetical protein DFP72DRAFT_855915 [Tulosesus angulatus]